MAAGDALLGGTSVVVTGAGSGLGRAYCVALAAAGANVLAVDLDEQRLHATVALVRSTGGSVHPYLRAVGGREDAVAIVAACLEAFGALDGFVANAGVLNPGLSRDLREETVDATLRTNVAGVWHCCVAAMDVMVPQGSGSIVTVVSGSMAGLDNLALYGTSKAAVLGMTYGLALELEGSGVRINAVSPLANTPMSADMDIDDAFKGGAPETVAPVVVHLVSRRSHDLHGQVVRFDGHSLGLVAPPRLAVTTAPRDGWSVDDIAAALAGPLHGSRVPVGLATAPPPAIAD